MIAEIAALRANMAQQENEITTIRQQHVDRQSGLIALAGAIDRQTAEGMARAMLQSQRSLVGSKSWADETIRMRGGGNLSGTSARKSA